MLRRDYLAVVEASYAAGGSDRDWLEEIAAAGRPMLDFGLGTHAWTYDLNAAASERMTGFGQAGGDSTLERGSRQFVSALSPECIPTFFSPNPPVEIMSRVFAKFAPTPEMLESMDVASVGDAIGLRGHSPEGRGLVLAGATPGPPELPPRTRWALSRVALHLAAAARLRCDAPAATRLDTADAVFSSRGHLEHVAESEDDPTPARILAGAVEKRLLANSVRADPRRALELWRALIAGRWSIVDHVDRDGKRFILAKSNAPGLKDPASLTSGERLLLRYAAWGHSNKLIAYETGLSPASVSTGLRRALRKVRVGSREELARLFANRPDRPRGSATSG